MEITLVLTILVVASILFASELIPMDVVSLMVLLALGRTGMVTPTEAFSGFSNPAVITVIAMFVISSAIANTGATGKLGKKILQIAGNSVPRLIVAIMLAVALISAFINNIGSTAALLPLVVTIANKDRIAPSKLLIPLAFGSRMGGVCTLIGTPPNLQMNELLFGYSGERYSLFDFTPVGLVIVLFGTAYLALIGRHLLPSRKAGTLTEAMSHAAAAVLIAPIAFDTALHLGVSPKPFFIAVTIGACCSFMTPISHQSNALVMEPGRYRFFDDIKVGTALNFSIWLLATQIIPLTFPFCPLRQRCKTPMFCYSKGRYGDATQVDLCP